jgi:hypothetical protein
VCGVLCGVRIVYVAWRGVVCVRCVLCALYMYNKTEQIWQDGAVSDRMGDGNVVCVRCGVNVWVCGRGGWEGGGRMYR